MLLVACKEKGPVINIPPDNSSTKDTTYIAPVEQPQPKSVLVEEFTGIQCPNCPKAKDVIEGLSAQYPDQVIAIAYFMDAGKITEPIKGLSKYDFRTQKALDINNYLPNKAMGLPKGGVDRVNYKDEGVWRIPNDWSIITSERMSFSPQINIHLKSTYVADEHKAIIHVKLAYTDDVDIDNYLSIAITEDHIIDAQENKFVIDTFYEHGHVLRDIITNSIYGDVILDSIPAKEKGRVFERNFVVQLNNEWKAENCNIVAFIHTNEASNKEIMQAAEIHLKE